MAGLQQFAQQGLIITQSLLYLYQKSHLPLTQLHGNNELEDLWRGILKESYPDLTFQSQFLQRADGAQQVTKEVKELVQGDAKLSFFIMAFSSQVSLQDAVNQAQDFGRTFLLAYQSSTGRSKHIFMIIAVGAKAECVTMEYGPAMTLTSLGGSDVFRDPGTQGLLLKVQLDLYLKEAQYKAFGGLIEDLALDKRNSLNLLWAEVQHRGIREAKTRVLWQEIFENHFPHPIHLLHEQYAVTDRQKQTDNVVIRQLEDGSKVKLIMIELKPKSKDNAEGRREAEVQLANFAGLWLRRPDTPGSIYVMVVIGSLAKLFEITRMTPSGQLRPLPYGPNVYLDAKFEGRTIKKQIQWCLDKWVDDDAEYPSES